MSRAPQHHKRPSRSFEEPKATAASPASNELAAASEEQLLGQLVLAFNWLERNALKGDGKLTFDFNKTLIPGDTLFGLTMERIADEWGKFKEQSNAKSTGTETEKGS